MYIIYTYIDMTVKTDTIKDIGKEIFRNYNHAVSTEFSKNKDLVEDITNIEHKEVRNQVAGYLVSLRNRQIESEDGLKI
jgi:ribosomal protein S17E